MWEHYKSRLSVDLLRDKPSLNSRASEGFLRSQNLVVSQQQHFNGTHKPSFSVSGRAHAISNATANTITSASRNSRGLRDIEMVATTGYVGSSVAESSTHSRRRSWRLGAISTGMINKSSSWVVEKRENRVAVSAHPQDVSRSVLLAMQQNKRVRARYAKSNTQKTNILSTTNQTALVWSFDTILHWIWISHHIFVQFFYFFLFVAKNPNFL
jgi:hypothetical protein